MEKLLILDADQRSALACIRSLGRLPGLQLYAADSVENALAGHSRHCAESLRCPSVREQPADFLHWLQRLVAERHIDRVFPMTEFTSRLILMHNLEAEQPIPLPFADFDTVERVSDKSRLVRLAESLGIPCPASRHYRNAGEVVLEEIDDFPVVIKPNLSHIWMNDHWLTTSVQIAKDRDQLQHFLETSPWLRQGFMLQQFIPGRGGGVFALYNHGQATAFFAHRRLREKPPRGGVSVYSESVALDPELQQQAQKLLDAAAWHGVAMVEFRIDPQGRAWLMEVNTRFWGSLQLAIDAGVDFPAMLYRASRGEDLPQQSDYRIGRRLRWLLGDVDSLYLVLRDREFPLSFKLRRLLAFLTPHPFSTRHEVFRWNDPKPAWAEMKRYLADLRGN